LAFKRRFETSIFASDASTSKGFAAGGRLMQANGKPHLVMTGAKGEPMVYQCSLCGQLFLQTAQVGGK
jgi:hypothetical protein